MASLCISCPLHAGIMSLSTPNSSFILDLLLRSIRLCAVFLAILRPAAVALPACFLLVPLAAAVVVFASCVLDEVLGVSWVSLGFI